MSKADLKIDWATHKAAKYAVEHWHYSRSMPAGKMVKIGVWENRTFIGVVLFSCGASPPMYKWAKNALGLGADQICELTRVALKQHDTPVSRILSIAMKYLKASNPGLKCVVSFADLDEAHHGGIYQAGNWTYVGLRNAGGRQGYMVKGRKMHCRSVGAASGENSLAGARRLDPKAVEIRTKGKHKYLMPFDPEIGQRIEPLAKPYPKRDKQAMADTLGTAAGQHRPSRSNSEAA